MFYLILLYLKYVFIVEVHRQKVKEYKQQLLDNKTNQIDNDCKKVMHEFEKAGVNKQLAGTYAKSNLFESYHIHCGRY